MLNNISNQDLILNNPLTQQTIAQQSSVAGVGQKTTSKNPYSNVSDSADVVDISDQAKKLYEKDQENQKYKSMVMDSLNSPDSPEQINSILDSINSGGYISNDALADKMLSGNLVLSNSEISQILSNHPEIAS